MSYIARPQSSQQATSHASVAQNFARFASPDFTLLSSRPQARSAGHTGARTHIARRPTLHHPRHQRQHLPPGIEQQPF